MAVKGLQRLVERGRRRLRRWLEVASYTVAPSVRDVVDVAERVVGWVRGRRRPDRVLGILDFTGPGFGLGDAIVFQENCCVLKHRHDLAQVDLCIIEDGSFAPPTRDVLKWRTQLPVVKEAITQTAGLNPYLGTVISFTSKGAYRAFRLEQAGRYLCFPGRRDQLPGDMRPIQTFYREHGTVPRLSADGRALEWARRIIEEHIAPARLIVIQVRRRPKGRSRNSNVPAWEAFLRDLDPQAYRVICICTEDEIIPAWRQQGLVSFSRDLGSDFLKDCALVQLAYAGLFPSSGMGIAALFLGVPCLVFNVPTGLWSQMQSVRPQLNGDLPDHGQYNFQSSYQRLIWEPDTYEVLKRHFAHLMRQLEEEGWAAGYRARLTGEHAAAIRSGGPTP